MLLCMSLHNVIKYVDLLPHMLYLEHCIMFYKLFKFFKYFPKLNFCISIVLIISWKMEHLLANVPFFIIFFKKLTFQRHPKTLVWSKGLNMLY